MYNEKNVNMKETEVIPDKHLSKVYLCKSITEANTTERNNYSISKFRRVKNNRCINISTGEIIEFKIEKTLEKQQTHFKKATNDLRRLNLRKNIPPVNILRLSNHKEMVVFIYMY